MNQLTAMLVFKRVVELNGFSAAARDLGLSNAAVSKNVNELETHLAAQLLVRTTRRVSVTEVGEAYYRRCIGILDDLDEANRIASAHAATPCGQLRVNAPMSFGILHLAPAISEFMERYDEINVDLVMNDRVVDLLDGGFDIGIRIGAVLQDSSLIARKLTSINRVLCGSPDYFKRFGTPTNPDDLNSHSCLAYSLSPSPSSWSFTNGGNEKVVVVNGRYRVNNSLALRESLIAGIGITLTPTFIVGPDLHKGTLKSVMTDWLAAPQSLYVVYPQARHIPQKVRVFIDFLSEKFSNTPYWDC